MMRLDAAALLDVECCLKAATHGDTLGPFHPLCRIDEGLRRAGALQEAPLANEWNAPLPEILIHQNQRHFDSITCRRNDDHERARLYNFSGKAPLRVMFYGLRCQDSATAVRSSGDSCTKPRKLSPFIWPVTTATGSVVDADKLFAHNSFDVVVLNGVLGWGVDNLAEQNQTYEKSSSRRGFWCSAGTTTV